MHGLGQKGPGGGAGEKHNADRPSTALGIIRCMAVCGIISDIEPNMPTAAAAGSAVASDDEAGIIAGSLALTSFGFDSVIERPPPTRPPCRPRPPGISSPTCPARRAA